MCASVALRACARWLGGLRVCLRCSVVWQDVTDEVDEAIRRMKTVEKRLTELASREALWSHVLEKLSTLLAYGRALGSPHNTIIASLRTMLWRTMLSCRGMAAHTSRRGQQAKPFGGSTGI